jgi:hypothetical protein
MDKRQFLMAVAAAGAGLYATDAAMAAPGTDDLGRRGQSKPPPSPGAKRARPSFS